MFMVCDVVNFIIRGAATSYRRTVNGNSFPSCKVFLTLKVPFKESISCFCNLGCKLAININVKLVSLLVLF